MASEDENRQGNMARGPSPYQEWQKGEGIPIYTGSYVSDLYDLELAPWPRVGQNGAFVNLANQEQDDAWVVEIAPAGSTEVQHHLCEATVFVLTGRGATSFWQEGSEKQSVEWQRGSIFAPPLNCSYRLFNGSGEEPVRLFKQARGKSCTTITTVSQMAQTVAVESHQCSFGAGEKTR